MSPGGVENFSLQLSQLRDIAIAAQPLDVRVATDYPGGGAWCIQQNAIEQLFAAPLSG